MDITAMKYVLINLLNFSTNFSSHTGPQAAAQLRDKGCLKGGMQESLVQTEHGTVFLSASPNSAGKVSMSQVVNPVQIICESPI